MFTSTRTLADPSSNWHGPSAHLTSPHTWHPCPAQGLLLASWSSLKFAGDYTRTPRTHWDWGGYRHSPPKAASTRHTAATRGPAPTTSTDPLTRLAHDGAPQQLVLGTHTVPTPQAVVKHHLL